MSVVTELRKTAKGAKAAPSRRGLRNGDGKAAAVFLAPWFLGLGLITIGPMIASGYLSFTDYDLLQSPTWIGIENYTRLFEDPRLLNSLRVTFTFAAERPRPVLPAPHPESVARSAARAIPPERPDRGESRDLTRVRPHMLAQRCDVRSNARSSHGV